jgi:hypothetical protein
VFAGQHRVSAIRQANLVSKINKCTQYFGVDQVLGQVDIEIAAWKVNDFALEGSAANQPRRSGCRDS